MQSNARGNRNGNARRFHGQNARDRLACVQTRDLFSDLHDKIGVDLLIEEAAHLEHIPGQDGPFRKNLFFKRLHSCPLRALPQKALFPLPRQRESGAPLSFHLLMQSASRARE